MKKNLTAAIEHEKSQEASQEARHGRDQYAPASERNKVTCRALGLTMNSDDATIAELTDDVSRLSLSFPNLFQKVSKLRLSSMAKLANRLTAFPIAFDDKQVKRYDTQLSAPIDYVPQDQVDELETVEDDRPPTSIRQIRENKDLETKSNKSSASRGSASTTTPSQRNGRGFESAKAWLLGWLVVAEMLYCHITHLKPHFHLAVQIAHILLPQAERDNDHLVSTCHFY